MKYEAIVIGASAGGIQALRKLLSGVSKDLTCSIFIVQHIRSDSSASFIESFNSKCPLPVMEGKDKDKIKAGHVYIAPPGYHLLINEDKSLSLSCEEQVYFSRPSIDVLFESAADVYKQKLIGIILTGANKDGSDGLKKIKSKGGLCLVQDPNEAKASVMPKAAISTVDVDHILPIESLSELLNKFV